MEQADGRSQAQGMDWPLPSPGSREVLVGLDSGQPAEDPGTLQAMAAFCRQNGRGLRATGERGGACSLVIRKP